MREPLPRLDRALIDSPRLQGRSDLSAPSATLLSLPEKAIQFGTGAFLRGFVEYFLDEANRKGQFGGRIVMVGSTGSGRDRVLAEQDGLYTLRAEGILSGAEVLESRVIGVVSRALSSRSEWDEVLACARDPNLELLFSNTTEVGISYDPSDSPELSPPRSFPGKLTRFLLERAIAFDYDPGLGLVVIPCELIEGNGDTLREIVLKLADVWSLDTRFRSWLNAGVPFCNTLVDRIVPGTPGPAEIERLWKELGYRDELLTTCEPYRLFAIEGDERLKQRIPFVDSDAGVLLTEELAPFRERKVRLLNGTHTAITPLAILSGCTTVGDAVADPEVGEFIRRVLFGELVPIVGVSGAESYAAEVLDRFANPFIRHALLDIMLQATMKLRVRIVPMIQRHIDATGQVPQGLALGFAAHLYFLRALGRNELDGRESVPEDDQGVEIRTAWASDAEEGTATTASIVQRICGDQRLWGHDLNGLADFSNVVARHLGTMIDEDVATALRSFLASPAEGAGAA